jgi:hypothetical protein
MTQIDLSLPVPESKTYKQPLDQPHINKKYQAYKQRVFDWGLKTALLWIIVSGLFKPKPPRDT